MKQTVFTVTGNTALTPRVYRMVLAGDTDGIRPGQFVEVAVPGKYLRRPISVCDHAENTLTLIYKVVGEGTDLLSRLPAGSKLDLLTGLGNGYDLAPAGDSPVLVGGGVGVPPLYALCKALLAQGKHPQVVLGFNSKEEIFLAGDFAALGVPVHIATADGSAGAKGFVTDVLKTLSYTYFYACGPMPMFRAMEAVVTAGGQYSLEERMGCGFGVCMGCTVETKSGPRRVCKDGPVFPREEVFFP